MKNVAELLPFDEGTMVLEIPKESIKPTLTPVVATIPPVTRIKVSSVRLVDEGFSYTEERSKRSWGSVVAVLSIALSVLLGFSGGRKTISSDTLSPAKKTLKTTLVDSKKRTRRQRRRQ